MTDSGPRCGTILGHGDLRLRSYLWSPDGDAIGPDPPPRVVLLHGLGQHALRDGGFAAYLAGRGFAVMAYDQRGHGASEGPRGRLDSFDHLLEDLDRVMEEAVRMLDGEGDPLVFGHSLGGLVALRWLQTRSARPPGVAITAPWLGTAVRIPLWKRIFSAVGLVVAPHVTIHNEVRPEALTRDDAARQTYLADPLEHHLISARLFREVGLAQARVLAEPIPPGIPLLFLIPQDDRVVNAALAERFARGLPGPVRIELLDGVRHEPLNDLGKEDVFRLIADWLWERVRREPSVEGRV